MRHRGQRQSAVIGSGRSGGDGFLVKGRARHTLLKGNIAAAAETTALTSRTATTGLTGNRALRNADLGIEAVLGVSDEGGNIASLNGDPFQCTQVPCS